MGVNDVMEKDNRSMSDSMMRESLPDSIYQLIKGKACKRDVNALRGSEFLFFDDSVLKITPCSSEDEEIVLIMKWLDGKIPVPKVIACEKKKESQYLLMSRVPGQMACDDSFLSHPAELLDILSKALKTLWRVDVSDCPCIRDVDTLLLKVSTMSKTTLQIWTTWNLPYTAETDSKIRSLCLTGYMTINPILNPCFLTVTFAFPISSLKTESSAAS